MHIIGNPIIDSFFDYAEQYNLALFPCVTGCKVPAIKWKEGASFDRAQWDRWRQEYGNFGISAASSRVVLIDIDASKVGRERAWQAWTALCQSWGLTSPLAPMCQSARGGWHVPIALPARIDSGALVGTAILMRDENGKELIGAKVRGYTVAPGSFYDGTGKGEQSGHYLLMDNPPAPHACPDGLIEALMRPVVLASRNDAAGNSDPVDLAVLVDFLNDREEFANYESWIKAGMAIKLAAGEEGRAAFDCITWPDAPSDSKWESFDSERGPGRQYVTIASFIKRARELGWKGHVRKSFDAVFPADAVARIAADAGASTLPLPPGATSALAGAAPELDLIQSSAEFVRGFVPPSYLVDRVLQLGYCYALTAQAGVGKTAAAMAMMAHVVTGRAVAGREVEKGSVLYFAGENPSDVQARWLGLTHRMAIDPRAADAHFVSAACQLSQVADRITAEVIRKGLKPSLVIVDTAASFFEGDNENDNSQAIQHAKRLRSLTQLPGNPCVLILCHPVKNATEENTVPRGGSGFLAEIDGNIVLQKSEKILLATAPGKFRGDNSWALRFELDVVRDHPLLIDARGRNIPTIVAYAVNETAAAVNEAADERDQDRLLRALPLSGEPGASLTDLARNLGWFTKGDSNQPMHYKVKRIVDGLKKPDKLAESVRGKWRLTSKGEKELNKIDAVRRTMQPTGASPISLPPFPPTLQ